MWLQKIFQQEGRLRTSGSIIYIETDVLDPPLIVTEDQMSNALRILEEAITAETL